MRILQSIKTGNEPAESLLRKLSQSDRLFPGGRFRDSESLSRRLRFLERAPSHPGLSALLQEENGSFSLDEAQDRNLEAAVSGNALFILTGQQPGLLGGPILWYYKALTCAALAARMTQKIGRPVVPIFWVAGDDSDLRECNHLEVLEREGVTYSLPFTDPEKNIPVSDRKLDEAALEGLLGNLKTVWNPEVMDFARGCFSGTSFTEGFLRLGHRVLGRHGVLFVNGYSSSLRKMARERLMQLVKEQKVLDDLLRIGTENLESEGLKPQVHFAPGMVHAFLLEKGIRERLFAAEGHIYTGWNPGRNLLSHGAVPGEITHDVVSRPLVAESIFPVLGHVLGPAELRYFGQLGPAFLHFTGDAPLVQHRMTASLVPESCLEDFHAADLDEYQSRVTFIRPSQLVAGLREKAWSSGPVKMALPRNLPSTWLERIAEIHHLHFQDQPGILEGLKKDLERDWSRYLATLQKQVYLDRKGSHQHLFRHLHWLANGQGQDRHLNIYSLLNALGWKGLDRLESLLDPFCPDEQIVVFGAGTRDTSGDV